MTIQFSTTLRNALLTAINTTISAAGTGVKLQIWSNVSGIPTNPAATNGTNVMLVQYTLAATWNNTAASGQMGFLTASLPLAIAAVAAGTAAYYRFYDVAGTPICHEQGTVTVTGGGGDMTIDNVVIALSQTVQVTGFTKTAPGA